MDQALPIGDLLRLLRRRLPILLLIASVGAVGSVIFALERPSLYETRAKILVESQQISDDLAHSTVNLSTTARLQRIEQRLMARDNLIRIIEELGLFADAPGLAMLKKVDLLREATRIEGISAPGHMGNSEGLVAFTITVTLGDAEQAAEVANHLVDSAIAENLQDRTDRARETLAYFDEEQRRVAAALVALEAEITAFKSANQSALPESLELRHTTLTRLGDRTLEIDLRLLELQEKQAELHGRAFRGADPSRRRYGDARPGESELRRLELELAQKRRVLSPRHPELHRLEEQIAAVETLVSRAGAPSAGGPSAERRPGLERQAAMLATQVSQLQEQKAKVERDRQALEASIRRTPEVEVALEALNRRLLELQERYSDTAQRRAEAQTGAQIEMSQQSERFQILEPALVPEEAMGPNRKKIVVLGSGASVGLAAGLAFLLELPEPGASKQRAAGAPAQPASGGLDPLCGGSRRALAASPDVDGRLPCGRPRGVARRTRHRQACGATRTPRSRDRREAGAWRSGAGEIAVRHRRRWRLTCRRGAERRAGAQVPYAYDRVKPKRFHSDSSQINLWAHVTPPWQGSASARRAAAILALLVFDQTWPAAQAPAEPGLQDPQHFGEFSQHREDGALPGGATAGVLAQRQPRDLERIGEQEQEAGGRGECERRGRGGKTEAPGERAAGLGDPVPLGRAPVQRRALGEGVPGPARAPPPLAEAGHRGVVPGHLGVEPPDLPAGPAQAQAELGLLAGDQTARGSRRAARTALVPHQRVAAAGLGLADRRVPLPVAEPVVDRGLRESARAGGRRRRRPAGAPRGRRGPASIQPSRSTQSPSTNCT